MQRTRSLFHESASAMSQTVTARLMRSINRSVVLNFIRQNSPIVRSTIARQLGISSNSRYEKPQRPKLLALVLEGGICREFLH